MSSFFCYISASEKMEMSDHLLEKNLTLRDKMLLFPYSFYIIILLN
jgi:hypothetical protein